MKTLNDEEIKKILLKYNYIAAEDVKKAEFCKVNTVVDYLLSEEIITNELLEQALAEFFGVPCVDLSVSPPSKELVIKIPENIAKRYNAVLIKEEENSVTVATDNPGDIELNRTLANLFHRKNVHMVFSLTENIEKILLYYRKSLDERFIQIINKEHVGAPEIIDEIIEDAVLYRVSDIHFEPQEEEVIVRFRTDGILQEVGRIPKKYYENVLNIVKLQAVLKTDEHFSSQDGAIRYNKNNKSLDLRLSIIPTIAGEKIVMRLPSTNLQKFSLANLGLSSKNQEIFRAASQKPFGMIIVSGPTGSGKSMSLYALLQNIIKPGINITTIEDPVEYRLVGVNQIQVDNQKITFAKGLRSIVRQDPNVILVGEVRDKVTAEIAVNIAFTGHLLLSSFHANDAATTITRLLDMGIEPFILSSALEIVAAQRLVRKICPSCRTSVQKNKSDIEKLSKDAARYFKKQNTLYFGKGCAACSNTGYTGRTAIFELISVTKEMRELILSNPSSTDVWDLATKQGSVSLFEDGIEKVKNGITTVEELLRVAVPPKV